MVMIDFGDQLLGWRLSKGLTQAELAKRADIPRPNISNIENGRADVSLTSLRRLADALELSLGSLLEKEPPRNVIGREERDKLVRDTLGLGRGQKNPLARRLGRVLSSRRRALGGSGRRRAPVRSFPNTTQTERKLRMILGHKTWSEVLRRAEKLAASPRVVDESS